MAPEVVLDDVTDEEKDLKLFLANLAMLFRLQEVVIL